MDWMNLNSTPQDSHKLCRCSSSTWRCIGGVSNTTLWCSFLLFTALWTESPRTGSPRTRSGVPTVLEGLDAGVAAWRTLPFTEALYGHRLLLKCWSRNGDKRPEDLKNLTHRRGRERHESKLKWGGRSKWKEKRWTPFQFKNRIHSKLSAN